MGMVGRSIMFWAFVVLGVVIASGSAGATPDSVFEGTWSGKINAGGMELTMILHLKKEDDGKWKGAIDSPDQGAKGIPVGSVILEGNKLSVSVPSIGGSYEADLDEAGNVLDGKWRQGGAELPLVLTRTTQEESDKAQSARRPQEPTPPYPYKVEDVVFENAGAGIKLAGTLTVPKEKGTFPAVVLVSGSGPQNRDEALLGHRPFFVLADHLTRRGIAVLRYDDRGVGESTGSFGTATSADFATDASAAIGFLKTRGEIDSNRLGIAGHSEGGLIAPIVANDNSDVSFIVLMAGPGVSGERILISQGALIARANGASEEDVRKSGEQQKMIFGLMKSGKSDAEIKQEVRSYMEKELALLSEEERQEQGVTDGMIDQQLRTILTPWFRYFLTYDPQPTLKKVRCPILAVNGEKDLQVPCTENLEAIEKAVRDGGNHQITTVALEGLNHLFQRCETGSPGEYSKIDETFSEEVMELIADWILHESDG